MEKYQTEMDRVMDGLKEKYIHTLTVRTSQGKILYGILKKICKQAHGELQQSIKAQKIQENSVPGAVFSHIMPK